MSLTHLLRLIFMRFTAWYQEHGAGVDSNGTAGRSFYTSLGHLNETWQVGSAYTQSLASSCLTTEIRAGLNLLGPRIRRHSMDTAVQHDSRVQRERDGGQRYVGVRFSVGDWLFPEVRRSVDGL